MHIVAKAMPSSRFQDERAYQGAAGATPPPKEEDRPRARRKIWSMWARAAVVEGEEVDVDSVVRDVMG